MQDSKDPTPPTTEEPKRTRRQRTPVTLLQHEYDVIYSYSNNHMTRMKTENKGGDNRENSQSIKEKQGSSESSTTPGSGGGSSSRSNKTATNPITSALSRKKIPHATTFQWIGEGSKRNETVGGKSKNKSSNEDGCVLYYRKVEIVVGGHPAVIQVGDDILVSSEERPKSDLLDKGPTSIILRNLGMMSGVDDVKTGDNQSRGEKMKVKPEHVAMNDLKPFIGRVEAMWEEGITNRKTTTRTKRNEIVEATDDRADRMKVKINWYYKREDVVKSKGSFVGIPRQKVLSLLTPRDVLLCEDSDENDINAILGKCRVVRCKPSVSNDDSKGSKSTFSGEEGTFRCCYRIKIESTGSKQRIIISPYDGVEECENSGDSLEEYQPPNKRSRANSYQGSEAGSMDGSQASESMEATEMEPENASMELGGDDDHSSSFLRGSPPNKIRPTTEGPATQQILVGDDHQAFIPPLVTGAYVSSRQGINLPPDMVWRPNAITLPTDFASFMTDASQILHVHMKEKGIEVSRVVPQNLDPKHLPSNFTCREFNMDAILQCLHQKRYDKSLALKELKENPEKYVFLWTKEEKALYNAGFRRHFSAIRSIAKGMIGRTNKTHCDVVDYHYRFKIPDQFQRYEDKKREQARRMLECVEQHRLNEFLSPQSSAAATHYSDTANGSSNSGASAGVIGASKKTQAWSRTGGGPGNSVGALERRRLAAREFLVTVKNQIGVEKYLILVNHLKGLHSRVLTVPQCREAFASVLKDHPQLMKCFDEYMPRRFRGA